MFRVYENGYEGSGDPAHYVDVPAPASLLEKMTDAELQQCLSQLVCQGLMTREQADKVRHLVPERYRPCSSREP